MRRWQIVLIAICAAVPVVIAMRVLDRDREAAVQSFAHEKLAGLTEAAQDLGGNLSRVGDDLAVSALVPSQAGSPDAAARELEAIASVKRAYLSLDVQPADGARLHAIGPGAPAALATPLVDQLLATAARVPGELQISSGLSPADTEAAWYRVFARATPGGAAAAAIVDMRQVVIPPRLLRAGASRLLVLSAHGVAAPVSDPSLAKLEDPALAKLVARAVDREPATARLDADAAAALGLPHVEAVAAAVPVPIDGGAPWVLALVASTDELSARHDALVRRMAIGGALCLVLLALATTYLVRTARREARLRERLDADQRLLRSEKLATAGQLAAGIAHEIGTPLGIVRGRAELALGRLGAAHAEAPGLGVIVEQIDHVTRLISQLLAYARPGAAHRQPIDARAAIDGAIELLAPEAARKGVALERLDARGSVSADPGQLQQVLVNVIVNAIDACSAGGRVTVAAHPGHGVVTLAIADTGHGIAPADRAQLFDPFFTNKKRGKGTGLGLWVVAELARIHGAELDVESAEGRGTTIAITWPASDEGRA
ncbi:MAG TPA: HAMP domain-containing sensor histidine kinase [Kofleriaceae bacterium]|jgi:signal transduction histidine kinase